MAKGKTISFDPRKDKRLMIFTSRTFPSWQQKYIDIVREAFDGLNIDMKAVSSRVSKMGEAKKAMPFVQSLKRKIDSNTTSAAVNNSNTPSDINHHTTTTAAAKDVFSRTLPFDEHEILTAMASGLRQTLQKCRAVEIIHVDVTENRNDSQQPSVTGTDKDGALAEGISGKIIASDGSADLEGNVTENEMKGSRRTNLPPVALSAEPGAPTFFFENV